jgi:hypothetical protein
MKNDLLLLFSLILLINFISYSQQIRTETNKPVEISLISTKDYNYPVKDVDIKCKLTHQGGSSFSISGFWDGNRSYKVRFSLPLEGTWQYLITSSDTNNAGLHNISGNVIADKYSGNNDYLKKGFIKVSGDGHYFTYGNGDPFFYLGESVWEINWKSNRSQVLKYTSKFLRVAGMRFF